MGGAAPSRGANLARAASFLLDLREEMISSICGQDVQRKEADYLKNNIAINDNISTSGFVPSTISHALPVLGTLRLLSFLTGRAETRWLGQF